MGYTDLSWIPSAVTDTTLGVLRQVGVFKRSPSAAHPPPVVMSQAPLWELARAGGPWVRLAGLSGAAAVVLGAMGAHRTFPAPPDAKEDLRKVFDTANRFHFLHTLALLGVPLCRSPLLSGSMFVVGMGLFCGTCYYHALTGERTLRRLTPVGGSCLILAWITLVL